MCYRRRATPKHCNNMIEVEFGGRGHRTRLRNDLKDQLVCLWGAPASVYKGSRGRGWPAKPLARQESPTPSGSRIPPLGLGLLKVERERGGRPPLLVLI